MSALHFAVADWGKVVLFGSVNAASTMKPAQTNSDEIPVSARQGLAYARAAGVATGCFLIVWAPFNGLRWGGLGPDWLLNLELVYFIVFGLLIALPWRLIQGKTLWRSLFTMLVVLSAGFAFLMVVDLMFQYMLASEAGEKPAPPAFQSLLIFTSLMQAPAVYFVRNPRAMT